MKNQNPILIVLSYLHRFSKLSGIAFAIALMMNALVIAQPLQPVDLGTAENYVILAKTAVSVVPTTSIVGNIGISPNTATSITGLALIHHTGYATSSQVTGRIYAAAMTEPTPSILTVAIGDMQAAYTDAAGRTTPDFTELHTGNLSGQTLVPGLYKWGTGVLATSNFTISGGPDDVWIFQIAGNLTLESDVNVILSGGASASNIFWQVAGEANIGTDSHFEGVILSQTAIHLFTGASINGRMLAQSAVTMDQNAVAQPVVAAEPSLALTTIVGNPTFLIANGISTSTITVTVLDAAGDPIGTGGDTIVLSATTGVLGIVTDNNDGTYTATYTSPTSTSGSPAVISGTLNGDTILDTAFIALNAGPASGANSTLVANPNTLPANGTSTSIVTATIRDANGNLTSGGANVVLSTNLGTLSSVTDNSNGTYTAVFTASVTTGIATISGTVNGQNLPTATVTMGAGVASTATTTIDASPTSLVANGTSTSTITVRLRDAEGNLLTTGGATIVLASTTGSLGLVTDNNDGTYTATFTSPTSTSGSPAVVSGTLNGSAILDTASITLTAGVASGANSTLTASPNTIPANGTSTSTVTVTLRDVNGNLVVSGGNTVLLNTNLGSLGSVTNNGNGTYTAILTSSLTTGTATINGTVNGQNLPSATVVMGAGVASTATTTIDASPTTLIANGISTSAITVILRDALGNLITTGSSTVTLAASVGTLGVVTNNGNGTYTATYSSPIFTAGSPAVISGTLNGNLIDDTAQIALVAGPVFGANSTMTASPNTLPANGTSTSTVTVTLRDVNGNLITGGGATVLLATDLGTLGSVSYNINGTYTATFTAPLTTGTATINGTANGQTLPAATILIGSGFASSATTTITANPTTLVANGVSTSAITVTLRDANDNLITSGGALVTLSTTRGTLGTVTDNNNGTYTATFISPILTLGSPAVISGTLNGNTIVDTAEIILLHGPASGANSTLVANPNTLPANGTSTSIVTATIRDANGNLTSGGANVVLSTNLGTLSSVTDNSNGTYTAVFTASVTTGIATISGTVNGQNLPTATVTMGAGVASTATTTIDASPTSLVANGTSTSTITVRLRDAEGNLLTTGGATIVLATTRGTLGFVIDNNDGTYTATFTSPTSTSGSPAVISGTLNGSAILDTASITLNAGVASGANSTLTASPNTIPANGTSTSTVTVTLRDVNGNLVVSGGNVVLLNTNLGSLGGVTNNGNGTYTAILTSALTTGTATINGTVNGQNLPSAAVVMGAGVASTATSTIEASPTTLIANGISTSAITVILRDAEGNLITTGSSTVTLAASVGTLGVVTNNGNGTYTATYSSPIFTAGSPAVISGTLNGNLIDDTAQITLVAGPVFGATSTMTASPNTLPANGTSTSTVTVTLRDVNGNLITGGGATVLLATDLGTLGSVSYNINGTYTATFTAPLTTGTATITGTANGQTLPAATILIGSGFASTATTTITANPTTLIANGVSTSAITVTVRDANGNLITTGGAAVTLSTTRGTLGTVTDNNNGTYTATFVSPILTLGSPAVISGTLNGNTIVDTAEIILLHGPALGSKSTLVAIPNALLADGVSTSQVTATIRDANGNLTSGGDSVLLSTNFGTLGTVTDNGNGTYTAVFTAPFTMGLATISGTVNMQNLPPATIVIGAGVASTATTTITANPTSLIANGTNTSVITVTLRDAGGNLLGNGGPEVQLFTTVGTIGAVDDNGDGTYTAIFISPNSVSGSPAIISGTLDGSPIIDTAQIVLTEHPASGANSTLTANPTTLPANGIAISIVTATIKDVLGNLTNGGDIVVLTTNLGSLGSVKDNGNGTYTAIFTAPFTSGMANITGTVNGENLPSASIQIFDDSNYASPLTSSITAYPILLPADGASQSEIIVTLRNSLGQRLSMGGQNVNIVSSLGTVSTVQDLGNGTYRAYLTSILIGKAHVTALINSTVMVDYAFVTFYESDVTNPVTEFFTLRGNVFHDANGSELWDYNSEHVVPGVFVTLSGFDIKGNPFMRQSDTALDGVYMITNIPIGRYEVMASFADNTTQAHPSQIGVYNATAPQYIEMLQTGDVGVTKALFTTKSDGLQGWASRTTVGSDNVYASAVFDLDRNGDGKADGSISVSGTITYTRQSIVMTSQNNGSSRINANVISVDLYGKDDNGNKVNIYLSGVLQPMTIDQANSSTEASVNWNSLLTIVIDGKQYTSELPINFTGLTTQIPLAHIRLTASSSTFSGTSGELNVLGSRVLTSFGPDFGYYFANYGSAPASYGTLIRDNGARHLMTNPGPSFGPTVTATSDGSTSSVASGGDGIVFDGAASIGQKLNVTLSVQNAGFVNAWIDFNRNGEFDANELIISNEYFQVGAFVKQIDVPINATAGNSFARFRISSNPFLSATGLIMDGEVEDYALSIISTGNAISGRVYEDLNGNKVYDNHDIAISGVMLYFDLNNNGVRDANEPFTTSNGDGMYMMWAASPGMVTVRIDNSVTEFTRSSIAVDLPLNTHVSGVDFIKGLNTSDEDDSTTPVEFSLSQNYPNPFNPSTLITYSIAEPGEVLLSVYDVTGRKVATLVSQHMNAGTHTVTLNASKMASGVYMYRIQSGTFIKTMKMTLIK